MPGRCGKLHDNFFFLIARAHLQQTSASFFECIQRIFDDLGEGLEQLWPLPKLWASALRSKSRFGFSDRDAAARAFARCAAEAWIDRPSSFARALLRKAQQVRNQLAVR